MTKVKILAIDAKVKFRNRHGEIEAGVVVDVMANEAEPAASTYLLAQKGGEPFVVNHSQIVADTSKNETAEASQEVERAPDDATIYNQTASVDKDDNWLVVSHNGEELSMSIENWAKLGELANSVLEKVGKGVKIAGDAMKSPKVIEAIAKIQKEMNDKDEQIESLKVSFQTAANKADEHAETITGINSELAASIQAHQAALARINELEKPEAKPEPAKK